MTEALGYRPLKSIPAGEQTSEDEIWFSFGWPYETTACITRLIYSGLFDELPDAQRTVITLRDVIGCTPEEVCEALGISQGNQRVLLHRARARVRARLERHFDD